VAAAEAARPELRGRGGPRSARRGLGEDGFSQVKFVGGVFTKLLSRRLFRDGGSTIFGRNNLFILVEQDVRNSVCICAVLSHMFPTWFYLLLVVLY
jgi:hypothetical protein